VGPEDSIVIQLNVYAQRDWCSPTAPYYELIEAVYLRG